MDLINIMNERVRFQSAEQRAVAQRWFAATAVAVLCMLLAIGRPLLADSSFRAVDVRLMRGAAAPNGGSGGAEPHAEAPGPNGMLLLLAANAFLALGMHVVTAPTVTGVPWHATVAAFWLSATVATTYRAAPILMLTFVASGVVGLLAVTVNVYVTAVAQLVQLTLYFARSHAWRPPPPMPL
jgi:hypothetical protein